VNAGDLGGAAGLGWISEQSTNTTLRGERRFGTAVVAAPATNINM